MDKHEVTTIKRIMILQALKLFGEECSSKASMKMKDYKKFKSLIKDNKLPLQVRISQIKKRIGL